MGLFAFFVAWLRRKKYPQYVDFINIYLKCRSYTLTDNKKLTSLYGAVNYMNDNNIPGDFVECGVWRGGSSMLMALTQLHHASSNGTRNIYLYDTFSGMTKPGEKDPWYAHLYTGMGAISLEEVKENMLSTQYPPENIIFVKGDVLQTIPSEGLPEKIAILRLDTDFYESTKHELEHLYPRIVRGGALIIDDYYSFPGSKKAFDEYVEQNGIQLQCIDIGTGIMAYKL